MFRNKIALSLLLILVACSLPAHAKSKNPQAKRDEIYRKLEIFTRVMSYVENNYIEEVPTKLLVDAAIRGMLGILDPHTLYMSKEYFKEIKEDTTGQFGGLGMEVTVKDNVLTVIAPIEDTPAAQADIRAGDQILAIDGSSTKELSLVDAVGKMKGPVGSKVTITILREGVEKPFDVTLKRKIIKIKSVESKIVNTAFVYSKIKSFQERTALDLENQLKRIEKKLAGRKIKGFILDLRNNPGGLLDEAVAVVDMFIDSGIIVTTEGRRDTFREVEMAHHKETTRGDFPMIVVVNEGSASASEIVAGAFQDHGRAVILGTRTFGKGTVQTIIDLEDGSGLKLTIAKYKTPKGRSIQATGIIPDIKVAQRVSPEETLYGEVIREKDLKGYFIEEVRGSKPVKGRVKEEIYKDDVQLARAVEYLRTWDVFKKRLPIKKTDQK